MITGEAKAVKESTQMERMMNRLNQALGSKEAIYESLAKSSSKLIQSSPSTNPQAEIVAPREYEDNCLIGALEASINRLEELNKRTARVAAILSDFI